MKSARLPAPHSIIRGCPLAFFPLIVCLIACPGLTEVAAPPARYEAPLPDGGSVYFVGNSFFSWDGNSLPVWLASLGKAQGLNFEVGGDIVPGELPLSAFLKHPAVSAALASGKYRVWVVQGQEREPVDNPAEFKQAARNFDRAIKASGGRMVLFMTWEFRWRKFMPQLTYAYESIGKELGIPIIPAGLVYWDCERSPPDHMGQFFLTASPEAPSGGMHENKLGMAANTYTVYAILTGRDPHGRSFEATGAGIDTEMLEYLSARAWARSAPRLRDSAEKSPRR
jgi:hypothetical protein